MPRADTVQVANFVANFVATLSDMLKYVQVANFVANFVATLSDICTFVANFVANLIHPLIFRRVNSVNSMSNFEDFAACVSATFPLKRIIERIIERLFVSDERRCAVVSNPRLSLRYENQDVRYVAQQTAPRERGCSG